MSHERYLNSVVTRGSWNVRLVTILETSQNALLLSTYRLNRKSQSLILDFQQWAFNNETFTNHLATMKRFIVVCFCWDCMLNSSIFWTGRAKVVMFNFWFITSFDLHQPSSYEIRLANCCKSPCCSCGLCVLDTWREHKDRFARVRERDVGAVDLELRGC